MSDGVRGRERRGGATAPHGTGRGASLVFIWLLASFVLGLSIVLASATWVIGALIG
jgi:hypothetical protein